MNACGEVIHVGRRKRILGRVHGMTNIYEEIRERVSAEEAAIRYGIEVRRHRARCIWHSDRHPSLSFKGQGCKCFSCGAGGSALDVAMRLFNVDVKAAAARLNEDFHIGLNMKAAKQAPPTGMRIAQKRRFLEDWRDKRFSALLAAERAADRVLYEYANRDCAWEDTRFLTALQARTAARDQLDTLQDANIAEIIEVYMEVMANAKRVQRSA